MSFGSFKNNVTYNRFVFKLYMYEQDLALNNLQGLICHKLTDQPSNNLQVVIWFQVTNNNNNPQQGIISSINYS